MIRALVEELKPIALDPGVFLTKLNHDLWSILRHADTPMLTTGRVNPVFPKVRRNTGGTEISGPGLASSKSVLANTLAVPAHRIGFTMNSRRFQFP